jgi:hypothetical protein
MLPAVILIAAAVRDMFPLIEALELIFNAFPAFRKTLPVLVIVEPPA